MAPSTNGTEPRPGHVRDGQGDFDRGGVTASRQLEPSLRAVDPGVHPVFDEAKLAGLRLALGEDDLHAMMAHIPQEAVNNLNQIRAAVDARDLDAARRAAHGLKGMASNFGAKRLAVAARAIELEAPTIEAIADRVRELDAIVEATRVWLLQFSDGGPRPGTVAL